ncbi:long-chain-fatty-acid--CoA ligase [Mycetocola tolaasinivorans]|uniref:long-chain-fatty-acid--CoA ligase n=1 Tax=Mycetocola tolaasinivorans TaxID=76635 RepID=UPI001FE3CE0D|nr:long-chain-fatty-acid--CoA ligase [Mycetocola tolaasinivorans]
MNTSSFASETRPWLASYAENVPEDIAVPEGNLGALVRGSAERYPSAVALEFFGATTTYAQLQDQIERVAEGLRRLGVRRGDTVALVLPNCPQHIVAFYAVLRLGAIVVEHNPLYTPRELRHQFEDHRAQTAIVWDKVAETVQDFPVDLGVRSLVSVNVTTAMPRAMRAALHLPIASARASRKQLTTQVENTIRWEKLLKNDRISAEITEPETADTAVIQYTSGTTGSPKGAVLSHANLLANAMQAQAWTPTITRGGCVVYAVLPMFHAYGLTLCLTFAMSMGARLVLFPKFDPDLVLKVMKKHPPTFFPAVPPIAERLMQRAVERGISLEGIEIAISGAMPLLTELVEPWEKLSRGYLVEGFGLSECSPVLMANPVAENRKAGTVGLPMPGTLLRVVDPDSPTVELPLGQPGELLVKGPQVFSGYYRKPEETAEVFVDGWFRTGDIVTIDEDGFTRIVDRIKELIITGGFNVSPSEVEATMKTHPAIADVAVVGLPSPHSGEDVVAGVIVQAGQSLNEEEVRAWLRERLTPYKVPRRIVVLDELPRSLIGKVLRREVRAKIQELDAA